MFILWQGNDQALQPSSTHWDMPQPNTQLCATRSPQTTDTTGHQRSAAGINYSKSTSTDTYTHTISSLKYKNNFINGNMRKKLRLNPRYFHDLLHL